MMNNLKYFSEHRKWELTLNVHWLMAKTNYKWNMLDADIAVCGCDGNMANEF